VQSTLLGQQRELASVGRGLGVGQVHCVGRADGPMASLGVLTWGVVAAGAVQMQWGRWEGPSLLSAMSLTPRASNNAPGLFIIRANLHLVEILENKVASEKSEVLTCWWLSCQPPPIHHGFSSFCGDMVVVLPSVRGYNIVWVFSLL